MNSNLHEKVMESLKSVIPITLIVAALCFTVAPISNDIFVMFVVGAICLILGMGIFTLGADIAMTPIGEQVGAHLTKSRRLWLIIAVSFLMGFIITVSEPDLKVLADQVQSIDSIFLIVAVGVGVGLFLVLAILRILFKIKLSYLLIGCYTVVFLIAFLLPNTDYLAVAFDSGGVTTGPMTVPFIMALGAGIASVRSDGNSDSDSFGLVALSSIGPILVVLILGILFPTDGGVYSSVELPVLSDSRDTWLQFLYAFPEYMKDVAIALAPIFAFFLLYQFAALHLPKKSFFRILIGLAYTYVGLVLFLTGANVGFMPAGNYLGQVIASLDYSWILIPLGMLIGYFIVAAEPAVHVLNKQVLEMTGGAIPSKALSLSLSAGVALSIGLAMLRILTHIPILWILIPGYALAILLTFVAPDIFTSIAFDSGGVASGTMASTFLLPFAIGASDALGGNVAQDAFGIVAMVAMTPLITIQMLGLLYKLKTKKLNTPPAEETLPADDDIIRLDVSDSGKEE